MGLKWGEIKIGGHGYIQDNPKNTMVLTWIKSDKSKAISEFWQKLIDALKTSESIQTKTNTLLGAA